MATNTNISDKNLLATLDAMIIAGVDNNDIREVIIQYATKHADVQKQIDMKLVNELIKQTKRL